MELGRTPLPGTSPRPHRGDTPDQGPERLDVVDVGRGDRAGQWEPLVVAQQVELGAGFTPIGGVWPRLLPLSWRGSTGSRPWRGTSPAERACPARPGWCGGSWATAQPSVHVWNQRWAVARVTPNRPSAFSQEHPETWTNSTVVSTALWSTRGRPVFGAGGSSGWTISQSPSGNTSLTGSDHARRGGTSQRF